MYRLWPPSVWPPFGLESERERGDLVRNERVVVSKVATRVGEQTEATLQADLETRLKQ